MEPTASTTARPIRLTRIATLLAATVVIVAVFWLARWYLSDPVRIARMGLVDVAAYKQNSKSPVRGTGFCIAPGRIVTSRHLVIGARRLVIRHGGNICRVRGIGPGDARLDLITVDVDVPHLSPLSLSHRALLTRQPVMAIGSNTVRRGKVRKLKVLFDVGTAGLISTRITSGLSGAPLLSGSATVTGTAVSTGIDGRRTEFVVSANLLEELRRKGSTQSLSEFAAEHQEEFGQTSQGFCEQAMAPYIVEDDTRALELYRHALKLDPKCYEALWRSALCCAALGGKSEALDLARRAVELKPGEASGYYALGNLLCGRGNVRQALSVLLKCRTRCQPDDAVSSSIAYLYGQMGDYRRSVAAYHEADRLRPHDGSTLICLAEAMRDNGQAAKSLAVSRAAARANPYSATPRTGAASAYHMCGRHSEELRECEEAVRIEPDRAVTHNYLARAYICAGLYLDALDEFRKALRIEPKNFYALKYSAYTCYKIRDYGHTISYCQKALRLEPKSTEVIGQLAWAYFKMKDYRTARVHFQRLALVDAKSPEGWEGIGMCYSDVGSRSRAIDAFEKATKIDPKDDYAFYRIGREWERSHRYPSAERYYKKAIGLNPKEGLYHLRLGVVYTNNGQASAADGEEKTLRKLDGHRARVLKMYRIARSLKP